jgi:hypothetical protein
MVVVAVAASIHARVALRVVGSVIVMVVVVVVNCRNVVAVPRKEAIVQHIVIMGVVNRDRKFKSRLKMKGTRWWKCCYR